jgi:hypothetical protein
MVAVTCREELFGEGAMKKTEKELEVIAKGATTKVLRYVGAANFQKEYLWRPRITKWSMDPFMGKELKDVEVLDALKQKHFFDQMDEVCLDFLEMPEDVLMEKKGIRRVQGGWKKLWTTGKLTMDVIKAAIKLLEALGLFKAMEEGEVREDGEPPDFAADYAEYAGSMDIVSFALEVFLAKYGKAIEQPFWWVKGAKQDWKLSGLAPRFALQ